MPPKIGKCICFTLCWILPYCSWGISEITFALPCKAVIRNSLTYVCSLWRTPCTKKMPSCVHMTSKRWCTGHSSAKKWQNLSNVLCSKSINMGSMVWACHPCKHPLQNSSRHLLALWGHPHLLLCSPPWADWATLWWGVFPQHVLQLHCSSSHTILGLTLSGTEWSSLPRSPDTVYVVLDVSSADLYIWASHLTVLYNSWQTQAFPGHTSSRLKVNAYFRALLKL